MASGFRYPIRTKGGFGMSNVKDEIKMSPVYPPIGAEYIKEVVIEPGLFSYPVADGEKPTLTGSRCKACGKSFFPKRPLCPDCFDENSMESVSLDNRGVIYSATVVRVPSPVGIRPPYAYGYVDIPANKIRVFAPLTGADPDSFAAGQEVELVLEPVTVNKLGQKVIGYKFRPVK
jgi:uncharacterized OB-fold protein